MQMLQKNEQKWKRGRLLSHRISSGSGIKWTDNKAGSGSGSRPANNDSSSKENDGGAASRANGSGGRSRRSLSSFTIGRSTSIAAKRIYIDFSTMRAMQHEIEQLPLPASLSTICLALKSSESVLEAHEDADYSRVIDDDAAMKSFEILGSYRPFDAMSLSPSQRKRNRGDEFSSACKSLVSRGSGTMLTSWEDVKVELSEVFHFTVADITASTDESQLQQQEGTTVTTTTTTAGVAGGSIPNGSRRYTQSPKKKVTPKRAHHSRHSPKKPRPNNNNPKKKKAMGSFMSMESFREQIKHKMGPSLFRQIFQQGEILASKQSITDNKSAADVLDEKIKQKESQRRSTLRTQEILAAKAKADKEREAQESASKLLRPLTPDEKSLIHSAMKGIGPESEILARQDADSVQRGSLQTLNPGQWLNDEIINYFLKNCLAKRDEKLCAKQGPGRKRSHFFNSFFVQTMFDEKNNNPKLRGVYNYKNVKRWSKKVPGKDIFNLKYVVCPINLDNMHWTSAVIFMEEKRIQYYDSMGGTDRTKLEGLLQYLKDEYRVKKGGELDVDEWELVCCTRDTPRQRNGFDCGVFTCMFCDFISKDCPLLFNQEHINQCRDRIALSIMKNCAVE
ncbi:hypothetical protein ACHAXR_012914 [Thalassiosira sp. AJA248-18]